MKTTKLTIALFAMTGAALHALAGASTSGTTLTLTAESGASYTHSTAIPSSITTVNKTGAGEVVLAAASPDCKTTSVAIQSGTLTISDLAALGEESPITGWAYTTRKLKTPRAADSKTGLFLNHLITLGNYTTFEYAPTTSGADSDRLISALTLTANATGGATLKSDARWGIYHGRLNPVGNPINKTGSGELFLEGTILGAGAINHKGGAISFKGDMTFNATSANKFDYTTSGQRLAFYSVTRPFPYTLAFSNWRTLTIGSGSGENMNVFTGPVTLAGYTIVTAGDDDCSARFDGSVTGGTGATLNIGKVANFGLNGAMSLDGTLQIGAGTWAHCASNVVRNVGKVLLAGGNVLLSGGELQTPMLRVANGDAFGGALLQTGGVLVGSSASDTTLIGEQPESRGCYAMEGGEAVLSNAVTLAKSAGSVGIFIQSNGTFRALGAFRAGDAGMAIFHQGGGTFGDADEPSNLETAVNGGVCEFAVSGDGAKLFANRMTIGGTATGVAGAIGTTTITVAGGGTLSARRFGVANAANAMASAVFLNLDGGILAPTSNGVWSVYDALLPAATVYGGGAVIDTSDAGGAVDWKAPFLVPSGKTIASITLPAEAMAASYANGPARIVVEGSGSGASAYARADFAAKRLCGVEILCGGSGYDATTRVFVESPDRAARWECAYALADAVGGPLVKRGGNSLFLHARNTYSGGTIVEGGTLVAKAEGSIPNNAPLAIADGAELNLYYRPLTATTLSGCGRVTGGNVTVTGSILASSADLFAGRHLSIEGALAITDGTRFVVTDPENLEAHAEGRGAVAITAASIAGMPVLDVGSASAARRWALHARGNTLVISPVNAFVMVIR